MFCRNSVKWLYRAGRNFSWESGYTIREDRIFFDSSGKVRLVLEKGGRITVTRGYAWNGCTPKMCFLDLLIGTPDGVVHAVTGRPKTYYASMVHDALPVSQNRLPPEPQASGRGIPEAHGRIRVYLAQGILGCGACLRGVGVAGKEHTTDLARPGSFI